MLGGIQAFGRREIFEFDVFLKNMYYGDFWSVLKKLWPEMQCCCFDQQRLALKISRLSFSTGLHWPVILQEEQAANSVSLSDECDYCEGEPAKRGFFGHDRDAEEVLEFHEPYSKYTSD